MSPNFGTMGSMGIERTEDSIYVGTPEGMVTLDFDKLGQLAQEAEGNKKNLVFVGQVIVKYNPAIHAMKPLDAVIGIPMPMRTINEQREG